jgi:hypothetical protein
LTVRPTPSFAVGTVATVADENRASGMRLMKDKGVSGRGA